MHSHVISFMLSVDYPLLVLILVLMEDTLALLLRGHQTESRSLNPCFNGRYTRTFNVRRYYAPGIIVLILVLMEDTLAHSVPENIG